jgi:chitodextrinase
MGVVAVADALSGTVDLPKIGRVKKVYVIGGLSVAGITIVYIARRRKAAAAPASTAEQQTDPAGNVGTIDPATGYVEGSPEDLAALSQSASYQTGTDFSGGGGDSGGSVAGQVDTGPPFTSNAAWEQYAIATLTGINPDLDPGALTGALGAYLAGEQVNQSQKDLINDATGVAGPVPVAGPNGYPPSINVAGSISGVGHAPGSLILSRGVLSATSITVMWPSVPGATGYAYVATSSRDTKSGTVPGSPLTVTGLLPATTYTVRVYATNQYGSGPAASISITTPPVLKPALPSGGRPRPTLPTNPLTR